MHDSESQAMNDSPSESTDPASTMHPGPHRRSLVRIAKMILPLVIFCILAAFLGQTINKARADFAVRQFSFTKLNPLWLAISAVLYLLGSVPPWLYFHNVLRAMGQQPTMYESFRAFYIGHLGKYVPGKFMVVLLRTGLLESHRTSKTAAGVAVFIETLTTMAVAATLAAVYLAFYFRHQPILLTGAIASSLCIATFVIPAVFRAVVKTIKLRRMNPDIETQLLGLNAPLTISGWLTIAASWLVMGLSLWASIMAMTDCGVLPQGASSRLLHVREVLPLLTACVCLAVVAGFVSMIPGGVGAREIVVTEMLPPLLGNSGAVIAAILIRLVWLMAELLVSAILYPVDPRRRPTPPPATDAHEP